MAGVKVGDTVPQFWATLQDGSVLDSGTLVGQKPFVLFFYPKDDTPLCTQEACTFRDAYASFTDAGAEVIGVSGDSPASHAAFAAKHRLPYPIVSDADGSLRRLFGVPRLLGVLPGRVTYVVDRSGVVRLVFNSSFTAAGHVNEALAALQGR